MYLLSNGPYSVLVLVLLTYRFFASSSTKLWMRLLFFYGSWRILRPTKWFWFCATFWTRLMKGLQLTGIFILCKNVIQSWKPSCSEISSWILCHVFGQGNRYEIVGPHLLRVTSCSTVPFRKALCCAHSGITPHLAYPESNLFLSWFFCLVCILDIMRRCSTNLKNPKIATVHT